MERKMFDLTKPVVTRDGRKARIICKDRESPQENYPLIVLVTNSEGEENPEIYTEEGKYVIALKGETGMELVNVPAHKWINVYVVQGTQMTVDQYETQEDALAEADEDDPQLLVLAQKVELYDNPF